MIKCMRIRVKYEPENDAKMQKNVPAIVAKGKVYHETKNGDSMNALALRNVQRTHS